MSVETRLDPKAWATLQARAALAGLVLSRLEGDRGREIYIVTKGAWTKELADVDAIERFLERASAGAA